MVSFLNTLVYVILGVLVIGTFLPLSSHPHWLIRSWDFPRVQIVIIAVFTAAAFVAINLIAGRPSKTAMTFVLTLAVLLAAWHLFRIVPYTPLMSTQAKPWEPSLDSEQDELRRLRVLVSNVEEENDQFARWSQVVRDADADVVIVAEVDERWAEVIEDLRSDYPNQVVHPQSNWYGMAMLSRFRIVESKLRFLVQDDIPSIDSVIELPSGDNVRVVGVHPRPPEPIRDNDATARDAELVLWGKELAEEQLPIVIGGDLNDVAWSPSTRLFLRLSQLLDPRRGRGFFNSFNANHIWMRFPLDHVFHSDHFAIRDVQRLPFVGSDHFPIFIDLQLAPQQEAEHEPLEQKAKDSEEAAARLERAEQSPELKPESVSESAIKNP